MKYDLKSSGTTTAVGNVTNMVGSFIVVKVPWYRRLWRRFR